MEIETSQPGVYAILNQYVKWIFSRTLQLATVIVCCALVPVQASDNDTLRAERSELDQKITEHARGGDLDGALILLDRGLKSDMQHYGQDHPIMLERLSFQHQIYAQQNATSKADAVQQWIIRIREAADRSDDPEILQRVGQHYASFHALGKAEQVYTRMLAAREKTADESPLLLAKALETLAAVHNEQRAYDKAVARAERAVMLRTGLQGAEHHDLVTVSRMLARAYGELGRRSDAELQLKRVIRIEEQSHPALHRSVLRSHQALAEHYYSVAQYDKSIAQWDLMISRIGEHDPQDGELILALTRKAKVMMHTDVPGAAAQLHRASNIIGLPATTDEQRSAELSKMYELALDWVPREESGFVKKLADDAYRLELKSRNNRPDLAYWLLREALKIELREGSEKSVPSSLSALVEIRQKHWPANDSELFGIIELLGDRLAASGSHSKASEVYTTIATKLQALGRGDMSHNFHAKAEQQQFLWKEEQKRLGY